MIRRNRPARRSVDEAGAEQAVAGGVRLQRVLAAAGVASRRAAEDLIASGRVAVNGEVVRTLPVFVTPGVDRIAIDGRPLARQAVKAEGNDGRLSAARGLYIMLYKPERVMSTTFDEGGRRTVMDLVDHPAIRGETPVGLGGDAGRVFPVGRLDFHTAGLVLLTNDGALTHRLTHPSFGVTKTYEVTVRGSVADADARKLEDTLAHAHRKASRRGGKRSRAERPIALRVAGQHQGKTVLEIELAETGERPLSDLLHEAELKVVKILRTKLGPLELSHLPVGGWRELERDELWALRDAAGLGRKKPKPRPTPDGSRPAGGSPARRPKPSARRGPRAPRPRSTDA